MNHILSTARPHALCPMPVCLHTAADILLGLILQIDLNMEPHRRKEMLIHDDGIVALPQLRVNGLYIGSGDAVQVRNHYIRGYCEVLDGG